MASEVENESSAPAFNSEEIAKLMGQGKRHYVCSEITQAVKCFEEACEALGKQYGELANECGDAYLFYGKALLELARMESNAIGTAFQEAPEEEDGSDIDIEDALNTEAPKIKDMTEEEKDKVLNNVIDAMTEEKEKQEKASEEKDDSVINEEAASTAKGEDKEVATKDEEKSLQENGKDDKNLQEKSKEETEKSPDEETTDQTNASDVDITTEEDENDKENVDDNENEDDSEKNDKENDGDTKEEAESEEQTEVSNIQLAWEFLELGRIIFERQEGKDACLTLAQCHLKLGEIKMEQEQFEDAIVDLMKCYELQKKHLESDDRLLAETQYNVGLCYNFQSKFEKAKEAFTDALNVIKLRMDNVEKRIEEAESKSKGKGKANADDPTVVDRKELDDLKEVYPEIKAKVDDANEMMINGGPSVEKELKGETTTGFGSSSFDDKPATVIAVKKVPKDTAANDISHLVKKVNKRKPEEESKESSENGEQPKKKARQENNGDASHDTVAESKALNGADTNGQKTATVME